MQLIILAQGIYYIVTGLWAVINLRSFEKVSGEKTDKWLVRLVGLLAADIGVVLLVSDHEPTLKLLGLSTALSFGVISTFYSLRGRISRVYLVDAVLEVGLVIAWLTLAPSL